MDTQLIQTKLDELSEELKREVLDYIDFLIMKHYKEEKKGKLTFDWEGGLSDLKEKYTSVELQHKAMEWR
ncbi:hypothetical protein KsCSTR_20030 [Candidatus Kuenenia stuttgartiensis]|uniref:DUF2281 domain-containing protein n=1 Tax=Kuenenia stuttgartiensis TaxID=174633 RepID=Q1Q2N7_KUEST|nr:MULTISPECIES: DUF2281 domain-containing protein [Kuenenia]MCZ7622383.1 DUF2281 domain-containing protein [Candidatus Kuenenia sp.]QII11382.1 hypothetical protein KsCSTR_20030 [Candidatus Kuenenia stuttgartiensis]CAJ74282.1 conserved hypothetical protein [Candidatus Kuenenia stuttgartiensis]